MRAVRILVGVRLWVAVVLAVGLTVVASSPAQAAGTEGSLDPSFGLDGRSLDWGFNSGEVTDLALQPDGKIVASVSVTNSFVVVRYNTNGSRDQSFGVDGVAATAVSPSAGAVAVAVQADGKIVAVGGTFVGSNGDFALVRFDANGTLDTGFAAGGIRLTPAGTGATGLSAVALQPDGKIVVGGYTTYANRDQIVARYDSSGTLDPTFGTNGQGYFELNQSADESVNAVALQPDGKIVTAGYTLNRSNYDFIVARYTAVGALDLKFNDSGVQVTPIGTGFDSALSVAILPNGQILAAGVATWANADAVVVRYNSDGSLDTGYAEAGHRAIDLGSNEIAYSLAIQRDGKAVIAGGTEAGTADFLVARLNPNGSLDPTFHTTGVLTVDFANRYDNAAGGVVVQRDGKIVAGGVGSGSASNPEFVRIVGDATPPGPAQLHGTTYYLTTTSRTLSWTATDDNTGVGSYDVSEQSAPYTASSYGPWSTYASATTHLSAAFVGSPGRTYCFNARARDYAGNVGSYGAVRCMAFAVDDRTLTVHGSWANGTSSAYYRGTYRVSTTAGSYLTLPVTYTGT